MRINHTGIEGLVEVFPTLHTDERGLFYESFNVNTFHSLGLPTNFVQENTSYSKKGVVRGLHFQRHPHAQGKLVTVLQGKVIDVVVDIRPGSKTFGQVFYCQLDAERRNMLMIPEGFAHGFVALEDTVFSYKCTNYYNKGAEGGIVWNDPILNIKWDVKEPIISDKDLLLPKFDELTWEI